MKQRINQLTEFLFAFAGMVMLVGQTVIIAFGAPMLLIIMAMVEYNRVRHGMEFFEVDEWIASMSATGLVLVNLLVEFWIHHRAQKEKRTGSNSQKEAQRKYKPSLRLYWRSVSYFLGIGGRSWKPKETTGVRRFENVASVTAVAIMALALSGSMRASIAKVSDLTWRDGISSILSQSSLHDIGAWVLGVMFTFAAVISVRALTRHIAERVDDVRRELERVARYTPRQASSVERARPEWSGVRGEIAPVKHVLNGKRVYRCPVCGKDMTRQAWSKHGCRFTPELTQVDDVDTGVDGLELVDVRQSVNQGVNHVNHGQ